MSEKILKKRKLSENDYQIEVTSNERGNDSKEDGELQNDTDSDCELIEEPPPPLIVLDSTFASVSSGDESDTVNDDENAIKTNENAIEKDNHIDTENTDKNVTTNSNESTDTTTVNISDDTVIEIDDFLFRIEFKNDKIFNEFKEIIAIGIQQCFKSMNKSCEIIEESTNYSMAIHENRQINDNGCTDIFKIDLIPTPIKTIIKDIVPEYRSSSTILFNDDLNASIKSLNDIDDARPMRRTNLCFNCDGEHSIKDCTKPRNFAKIRANRQRFSSGKTAERYHIDVEQKFAKYQPGVLSNDLRNAMGLKKGELPLHILKMH